MAATAAAASSPRERRPLTAGRVFEYAIYFSLAVSTLGPFLWIVLLSFKTRREFASNPFGLPSSLYLDNYVAVFQRNGVLTFLANSLMVSGGALVLLLVASVMAAYAIARIPFRGRNVVFVMFLLGDAIPLVIVIIPLFVLIQRIGLGNNILALIFSYVAMNIGVAVFILRGFFRSIHTDLIDAARLDGCNTARTILQIMLPLARPALIVVAVTNFISFWNEYFLASILMSTQSSFTLPAGLAATFVNQFETNWPVMAAAVVLMTAPILVIFIIFQRYIVQGWAYSMR